MNNNFEITSKKVSPQCTSFVPHYDSALYFKSDQLCLPYNDRSIEKYQMSDLTTNSNDLPEIMNPKIDDDEKLSEDTDGLFFKNQVWPSCHQLCVHAEYFGAYWGL